MRMSARALVLVVLLGTGCTTGGDASTDDPSAAGSATESTTVTPTETPTESPSETSPETSPETPDVAPATGPKMDVEGISVRLPEGWESDFDTPIAATAIGKEGRIVMSVLAGEKWSLGRLLRNDVRLTGPVRKLRRLPDSTMDGNPAYHYRGRYSVSYARESFGTWDDGYQVFVMFDLHAYRPKAKRRDLVESVMATYSS